MYVSNQPTMKIKFLTYTIIAITTTLYAGIAQAQAQPRHLKAQYSLYEPIPKAISDMDEGPVKQYLLETLKKEAGKVFTLYFADGQYAFALSNNDNASGKFIITDKHSTLVNMTTGTRHGCEVIIDKQFLISDSIAAAPQWTMSDETETIAGKSCIKASCGDTVVWFSNEIPIPIGPNALFGLPGLVLKATMRDTHSQEMVTFTLQSVEFVETVPQFALPTNLPTLTRREFDKLFKQKMQQFDTSGK